MKKGLLLVLVALLLVLPGASAQEALDATFTSVDGAVTFNHPAAWTVDEFGGTFLLTSADELFIAVIQVGDATTLAQFDLAEGATADDILSAVITQIQAEGTDLNLQVGEIASAPLGAGTLQTVTVTGDIDGVGNTIWLGVVTQEDGTLLISNALVDSEGVSLDTYLPTLYEILLTVQVSEIAPIDPSTLNVITADSAVQVIQVGVIKPIDFITLEPIVEFAPTGDFLAFADGSDITLADPTAVIPGQSFTGQSPDLAYDIAISPDASLLVGAYGSFAGETGGLEGWNIDTGESLYYSAEVGNLQTLDFTPDGAYLVAGTWAGDVMIFNPLDGTLVSSIPSPLETDAVTALALSPDGTQIAVASQNPEQYLRVYSAINGELLFAPITEIAAPYTDLEYTADGLYLVGVSELGEDDVTVWSSTDGSVTGTFEAFINTPTAMALSPDSSVIVVANDEGILKFFNAAGEFLNEVNLFGVEENTYTGDFSAIRSIDFNPEGTLMAVYTDDALVRLFSVLR